ncbi:ATP-binding protein [Galbitalea sp. SE-J8]|uniref:ATP-binding protein n=1 Tax=Galbitalea sp. SE-J8 TaxID=3054952 RepID=UPI00259CFBB2|nr:ATP-binding protein [Galbitalea sp. SE-J8]MDM4761715.1 ATP-binding protein [Galbitalea sp. SE-J8]
MTQGSLRDAAEAADTERFVGRAAELALVRDLLDDATPSRVLFVHGPGGIGKSSLIRMAGRVAAAAGFVPVRIDARTLSADVTAAVDDVVRRGVDRACVLVDELDQLGSGAEALRDRLLDALPGTARLVVAGRRGPGRSWREDGLDAIVVDLRLRPLADDDAGALLDGRGVAPGRIPDILDWAQGSPLALTVAASAPGGPLESGGAEGLEQRLTAWLAGQPKLDVPADILEVAALARSVDARLLAAALPGRSTRDGLERLAALPVVERIGDAVALHAVLAAAIRARLRTTEPARAAGIVRRIAAHLATRARLGDMSALLRLSRLLESPQLREAIANEASDDLYADHAHEGELGEFGRAHGFDRGADWPELLAWVGRWPERTLLMRSAPGRLVMFSVFVTVGMLPPTGAIASSLATAARATDADPERSFAGVVLFADAPLAQIAEAARLGSGAFMLRHGVPDVQSILIHYPEPDRRPPITATIASEVLERMPRPVALSDFRPAGVVGNVEAMVLAEQGFLPRGGDRSALLSRDDDVVRIARLVEVLDEVFVASPTDRRLRRAIELVHLGSRHTEEDCLAELHVSRRSWYRLLRAARERVAASG